MKLLWAAVLLSFSLFAEDAIPLTVAVRNYANVSAPDLDASLQRAGRVLRRAGIEPEWVHLNLDPQAPMLYLPNPALALNLLPKGKAPRKISSRCLGYAIIPGGGLPGYIANVFEGRVRSFANRHGISFAAILGHVIAHEVGHLLLDNGRHAVIGIMKSFWLVEDRKFLAQGTLNFTPEEAADMRRNLLDRRQLVAALSP
jgi:hypothetical protein